MLFLWFSILTFVLTKRANENMENDEIIIHKLNRIEKHIFGLKEILNVEELSDYTGFKKSYIYKLVHSNSIALKVQIFSKK